MRTILFNVSLLMYRVFLWMYPAMLRLVAPWNAKAQRWLRGRAGLLQKIKRELAGIENKRTIWMHCASLGEFEQGRPVLEKLRDLYPHHIYILTFFSPSGYEATRNYRGAHHMFYLPMDSRENARQLADLFHPELVLWVKYDYWYYYLSTLKQRGIPILLLSSIFRKDQPFFRWYGTTHRRMLRCITHFFVQNEYSQQLLHAIKVEAVTVSGDTRFDRVIEIAERAGDVEGIAEFCGQSSVIVAGSTWQEDDEELDHFANTHPEIKFIVAPHEVDEDRIKEVERLFKHSVRYSQWLVAKGERRVVANVLIIDNIGLLSRLYRYATITWVGGGFGDDGVHNVLEAAVYGKPVIFGPTYDKYIEATELVGSGGGFSVENALEAEGLFSFLLADKEEYDLACESSREYVYSRQGATERIITFIQENRLLTS